MAGKPSSNSKGALANFNLTYLKLHGWVHLSYIFQFESVTTNAVKYVYMVLYCLDAASTCGVLFKCCAEQSFSVSTNYVSWRNELETKPNQLEGALCYYYCEKTPSELGKKCNLLLTIVSLRETCKIPITCYQRPKWCWHWKWWWKCIWHDSNRNVHGQGNVLNCHIKLVWYADFPSYSLIHSIIWIFCKSFEKQHLE